MKHSIKMNSGKLLTLINLVKRVKNQSSAFAKVVEAFTGEAQYQNLINHVLITQKSGGKVFRDLSPNSHLVEIKCNLPTVAVPEIRTERLAHFR